MLVGDHLIYIQLQKTGSTRISHLIKVTVGAEERSKHDRLRRRDLDEPMMAAKYVLGSVRNPWSYYVSLWAFGCSGAGGLYEQTTGLPRKGRGENPQGRVVHNWIPLSERDRRARKRAARWLAAYEDVNDRDGFREWMGLINDPEFQSDLAEGYAKSVVSVHAGLLTYRYLKYFTLGVVPGRRHVALSDLDGLRAHAHQHFLLNGIIRTESLADDLERVLREAGYDLAPEHIELIHGTDRRGENRSEHRPADWYHDDRTRRLVADRDRLIIERHGYSATDLSGRIELPRSGGHPA